MPSNAQNVPVEWGGELFVDGNVDTFTSHLVQQLIVFATAIFVFTSNGWFQPKIQSDVVLFVLE